VCSCAGWVRNLSSNSALDLHDEVAKLTVTASAYARIVLPLQGVGSSDLEQFFSPARCTCRCAGSPTQAAVKGVPFVKSESYVGCVVVTRLRPIRRIIRQQDHVPAGSWCTVGDDVFDPPNILDEIVPTEVLRSLAPQSILLVFEEHLQCPGLVLELDSENIAVLFDPDVDVNPLNLRLNIPFTQETRLRSSHSHS
jgi:hypothetical protein